MSLSASLRISLVASMMAVSSASAGIWGVPTNLNANGTTSATSANPPGWFTLERQNSPTQDGDTVHQIRFFIEVTGTTLDIKVFDPGTGPASANTTNGARDLNASAPPNTRYTLYDPSGAVYNAGGGGAEGQAKNITSDLTAAVGADAITEDRLVRFSCNSNAAPTWTAANAGAAFGSGAGNCATALARGVWIFEATVTNTSTAQAVNAFGLSITDVSGAAYNVYTTGLSDNADAVSANETAFLVGTLNGTAPTAAIAMPMVLYPYVNRGCSMGTSNFDDDLDTTAGNGSSGTITDTLGTSTTLTMSNNDTSVNNTITVEPAAGFNLTANNYGLFTVEHFPDNVATAQNFIDWRFADWQGFTSNGNSDSGAGFLLPPDPVDPLRVYIPNSYSACSFAAGCTMGAPPAEPYLTSSAVVVSGPNPPVAGSATRYLVSASIYNPTGSALSDVFAVLPILSTPAANITNAFFAGSDACFVDGVAATCTFTSGADAGGAGTADDVAFRRAQLTTPATLAAGATFTYQYQVNVTLGAAFGGGTIPVTPAPAALGARAAASNCSDAPANVNRTINACYTPLFSSATFDRVETLGPVCDLRTSTTTAALTAARIRAFSVTAEGIAFSVVAQRHTAAFRVFSLDGNQRTLLGSIKALVPDSAAPLVYSLARLSGPAPSGLFEIEEVETTGALRRYGPFSSSDDMASTQVARLRLRLQAAGALSVPSGDGEVLMMPTARSASLARSFQGAERSARLRSQRAARRHGPPSAGLDGLRIGVTGGGPVRVSRQDLVAAGLPDSVRTGRLRVWNLGAPVDASVVDPGTPDEALAFDAAELSTTYSSVNSYVVTWGGLPRPPVPSVAFSSEAAPRPAHTERVEKNVIYLASAPQGSDPWLWDYLSPGTWPLSYDPGAGAFDLPGLVPGTEDVPVTIHLVGASDNRHTVTASINGVPAGEVIFTGRGEGILHGSVPASALLPTGNSLVLIYAADTTSADDFAAVFLDAMDLGVTVERPAATVTEIVAYDADLALRSADYLVVTHPAFAAQAQEIVSLKNSQGFRARAVDLARIYDRFSSGVPEAASIQKALRSVPGLKYALLVGDDTIDYHNYYGLEPFPVLPSLADWETESGRVPSENRYADFDDDGAPEIAIGRLPVQTSEEAAAAVAKIRRQSQVMAQNRGKYLFVTDNQGPNDPSYRAHADAVAAGLPATATMAFADATLGVQAARDEIAAALASGAAVTSYFGHGSPDAWADEGILSSDSVSTLAGLKETLVLMWACQSQYYTYFYGPSLGEALFLLPQGGAIASVGPAGISSTEHQEPFYAAFYRELAAGRTIGDALRTAKREVASGFPAGSGLVGFNLIGDPSLRP